MVTHPLWSQSKVCDVRTGTDTQTQSDRLKTKMCAEAGARDGGAETDQI